MLYFNFIIVQRLGIKRNLQGEHAVMRKIHSLFQVNYWDIQCTGYIHVRVISEHFSSKVDSFMKTCRSNNLQC